MGRLPLPQSMLPDRKVCIVLHLLRRTAALQIVDLNNNPLIYSPRASLRLVICVDTRGQCQILPGCWSQACTAILINFSTQPVSANRAAVTGTKAKSSVGSNHSPELSGRSPKVSKQAGTSSPAHHWINNLSATFTVNQLLDLGCWERQDWASRSSTARHYYTRHCNCHASCTW